MAVLSFTVPLQESCEAEKESGLLLVSFMTDAGSKETVNWEIPVQLSENSDLEVPVAYSSQLLSQNSCHLHSTKTSQKPSKGIIIA